MRTEISRVVFVQEQCVHKIVKSTKAIQAQPIKYCVSQRKYKVARFTTFFSDGFGEKQSARTASTTFCKVL